MRRHTGICRLQREWPIILSACHTLSPLRLQHKLQHSSLKLWQMLPLPIILSTVC